MHCCPEGSGFPSSLHTGKTGGNATPAGSSSAAWNHVAGGLARRHVFALTGGKAMGGAAGRRSQDAAGNSQENSEDTESGGVLRPARGFYGRAGPSGGRGVGARREGRGFR